MTQRTLQSVEPSGTDASLSRSGLEAAFSEPGAPWKQRFPVFVLLATDTMALLAAIALAPLFLNNVLSGISGADTSAGPLSWVLAVPLLIGALALSGAYVQPVSISLSSAGVRAIAVLSFAAMLTAAMLLALSQPLGILAYVVMAWAGAVLLFPLGRGVACSLLGVLRRYDIGRQPIVVVGPPEDARAAARMLQASRGSYRLSGVIELPDAPANGVSIPRQAWTESTSEATDEVRRRLRELGETYRVLVTAPAAYLREVDAVVLPALSGRTPVYLDVATVLRGASTSGISHLGDGIPAVRLRPRHESWHYWLMKRAMDLVVASAALVLASPLLLAIALAIKVDSRGGVVFSQTRVGRQGKTFSMYKFRSMRVDAESVQDELMTENEAQGPMFKIRDDPRITRVGKIIRRLSLDELPQLVNVLRGDMSMVGPRPPLPREVMQYEPWQIRRLELTPGITGLWQVCRSDTSSFDEMVQMDLDYIDHWSLALEVKILLKTLPAMILARGAY